MDMILRKIKSNKMRYLKKALCCTLSFFLTMTCVALSVLVILDTALLPETVRQVLASSHYYENLQEDIYRKAETMTVPTGLSPDVLKEIFLQDEIIREVDGYISASVHEVAYRPATGAIESRLEDKIRDFMSQRGIEPDGEQQESVGEYIASVSKEYEKKIRLPLISYFCTLIRSYQTFRMMCWLLCTGLLVLNLALLRRLNQNSTYFMQYMYCSTVAWAWMLLLLPGILLLIKPYNAIQLYPQYMKEFISQYITIFLRKLLSAGMAAMLFSFLMRLYERGNEAYGKGPSPDRLQES